MNERESQSSGGLGDAVSKTQDAVGAAVGKAAAGMGARNAESFVKNAAISNQYEIEAAQVALERARSQDVRTAAQTILADHQQVAQRMPEFVARSETDVEIPTELDQRRQGMVDNLRQISDDEFDKQYVEQQVAAHEEAVSLFEGFDEKGNDAELTSFARETLPTLREHLEHVRRLKGN